MSPGSRQSAMRTIKRDRASRALERRPSTGTQQAPFTSSARAFSLLARHNIWSRGDGETALCFLPSVVCRARVSLRDHPPTAMTSRGCRVDAVAERLGAPGSTVRRRLRALVEAGEVEVQDAGPGGPPATYRIAS